MSKNITLQWSPKLNLKIKHYRGLQNYNDKDDFTWLHRHKDLTDIRIALWKLSALIHANFLCQLMIIICTQFNV